MAALLFRRSIILAVAGTSRPPHQQQFNLADPSDISQWDLHRLCPVASTVADPAHKEDRFFPAAINTNLTNTKTTPSSDPAIFKSSPAGKQI